MPKVADPKRLNRTQRKRAEIAFELANRLVSIELKRHPDLRLFREQLTDFAVDAALSAARCFKADKNVDFKRYVRMRVLYSFQSSRRASMRPNAQFDRSIRRLDPCSLAIRIDTGRAHLT